MKVDLKDEKLIFPIQIEGRERNDGFNKPENFVVFECVDSLLTKGYRPEHIELEKVWSLGHDAKSGRADICVYDENHEKMLFIIECKTFGKKHLGIQMQMVVSYFLIGSRKMQPNGLLYMHLNLTEKR